MISWRVILFPYGEAMQNSRVVRLQSMACLVVYVLDVMAMVLVVVVVVVVAAVVVVVVVVVMMMMMMMIIQLMVVSP